MLGTKRYKNHYNPGPVLVETIPQHLQGKTGRKVIRQLTELRIRDLSRKGVFRGWRTPLTSPYWSKKTGAEWLRNEVMTGLLRESAFQEEGKACTEVCAHEKQTSRVGQQRGLRWAALLKFVLY